MSTRLTLSQLQAPASRIQKVLGIPALDPRFTALANQAQIELLERPEKWWGSIQTYLVCAIDENFTWPRQFAAIEQFSVCGSPVPVRNQWYEFQSNGPGRGRHCVDPAGPNGGLWRDWNLEAVDRGTACCFSDIIPAGKKIAVYVDVAEAAGASILLQGYDDNGNWIRTNPGGTWQDGETLAVSVSGPVYSVSNFSALTGTQKPPSNGNWRLYEYTVATGSQRALAVYEPDETVPMYRRSHVRGLKHVNCCSSSSSSSSSCPPKTILVVAKMAHIDMVNPTDYAVIQSIPAFKEMMQAIQKQDDGFFDDARKLETSAIARLQAQLKHFTGDPQVTISVNSRHFNSAAVENIF